MEVLCCLSKNNKDKISKIKPINEGKPLNINYGSPLVNPAN